MKFKMFYFQGQNVQKLKTESRKTLQMKCQMFYFQGQSVQVLSANYGRTDRLTCPSTSIKTTSCKADRTSYVKTL